ncbi:MAG: DUF3341 domain-containing protein [Breznakibacter sp.]
MKPLKKGIREAVTGYYADETDLLKAVKHFRAEGIKILDVHTPFPVHGLDDELELPKQQGLATAALLVGIAGLLLGFGMQIAIHAKFYPINFGGKPFLAIPSFFPVVVMLVFLLSAFAVAFAFMVKSGLGAGAPSLAVDASTTDDRFLVVLEGGEKAKNASFHLQQTGAMGIQSNNVQPTC